MVFWIMSATRKSDFRERVEIEWGAGILAQAVVHEWSSWISWSFVRLRVSEELTISIPFVEYFKIANWRALGIRHVEFDCLTEEMRSVHECRTMLTSRKAKDIALSKNYKNKFNHSCWMKNAKTSWGNARNYQNWKKRKILTSGLIGPPPVAKTTTGSTYPS
jgi:hypothetical protein